MKGLGHQPHIDKCRQRFEEAMREEAKVKRSAELQEEFKRKVKARE